MAFVNFVFSQVLGSPGEEAVRGDPHLSAYEPLCQARANNAPGRVEVLLPGGGREATLTEAELIARKLLQLYRDGYEIYERDEVGRPFR